MYFGGVLAVAKIAKVPTWVQDEQLRYQIGLSLIPGVGDITAKKLVAFCGGVEAVFREKKHTLEKIPTIGPAVANAVYSQTVLGKADQELAFIRQHGITAHWYLDESYPHRLRHCEDGPVMLYTKGRLNLNAPRTVSIVGTRKCTNYGRQFCE